MRATIMYRAGDVRIEDVPAARIEPGRVVDWTGSLDQVPNGYRAMNARETIKAMIEF